MAKQYKINWYQPDGKKIPAKEVGGVMYGCSFPTMLGIAKAMSSCNGNIGVIFARRDEAMGHVTWHPYSAAREGHEMEVADYLRLLIDWGLLR